MKQPQEAVSAAFTNLVYNPDSEIMKENVDFYLDDPVVKREQVVNLEADVNVSRVFLSRPC